MDRVRALAFVMALGPAATIVSCGCPPPLNTGPSVELPRRLLGRVRGGPCPEPRSLQGDHWEVRSLFEGSRGEVPRFLQGHCVYQWIGKSAPDITALPADRLDGLFEDPPVVSALQATGVAARRKQLLLQSWPAVEGASPVFPSPSDPAAHRPVFIGFPDSSPSNARAGVPASGSAAAAGFSLIPLAGNAHGFNLAWMSRWLTCRGGAGACLSEPVTELAFNYNDAVAAAQGSPTALDRGAAFGSRTAFADAIFRIVRRWREAGDGRPLVLNLAAGWEPVHECAPTILAPSTGAAQVQQAPAGNEDVRPAPVHGSTDDKEVLLTDAKLSKGTVPPTHVPRRSLVEGQEIAYPQAEGCNPGLPVSEPSQAVYRVLTHASCQGALIVAAAGNDPGYSPPLTGPMYPAIWEKGRAPSPEECRALGYPELPEQATYHPLVHAVAAVDGGDLPILVGRQHSRSRLAAPGSLLVAYPDDATDAGYAGAAGCTAPPCPASYPMTGTSVAATVTSSIAAAVWANRPGWTASRVMEAVYEGAVTLKEKDTAAGSEQPVRPEVCLSGACGSLEVRRVSMCGAIKKACERLPACPFVPVECADRPAYAGQPAPDAGADASLASRDPGTTPVAYVTRTLGAITGQPVIPCPPCGLVKSPPGANQIITLRVGGTIASTFWAEAGESVLRQPVLRLFASNGRFVGSPALSGAQLSWSSTSGLTVDLSASTTAAFTSATLTFSGGSGALYTQELPVEP